MKGKGLLLVKQPSPLRIGIISVLEDYFKTHVLAYGSQEELEIYEKLIKIEMILIDLDTPINLIEVIERCRKQGIKVVVWASRVNHPILLKTFEKNLNGYFYNGMESHELTDAIQHIFNGNTFIHPSLTSILLEDYTKSKTQDPSPKPVGLLSSREWEVMELISKGFSNEQIGKSLWISEKTVKNHVSSILKKLQVVDRTNALLLALRNKWITL